MLVDIGLGAGVAFTVSLVACRALIQVGPLDMPGLPRKAGRPPTPTSGGLGAAIGLGCGLVALALFSNIWRSDIDVVGARLLTNGALMAYAFLILGIVDDHLELGPRLKLAVFSALALSAAYTIGAVTTIPLLEGQTLRLPFAIGLVGAALWVFAMVNFVNFMDGSNGLAMGSVAIGLIVCAVIAIERYSPSSMALTICAAASLLGFLPWNFPGGRLFAGDAGALFAGAIAAIAVLILIKRTGLSPLVGAIAYFPLVADALLTLAWRAGRGRSLLDGHAEHIYQIAIRAGWSHAKVALAYWAAMALCGAIAIFAARDVSGASALIALGVLVVAALITSHLIRAAALKRGIAEA